MTRYDTLCILAIVMGVFLMCATPYAHPLYDGAPWADAIGKNFNLTTCGDARDKIIKLGERKRELQRILIIKDTPGMHAMLDPKIELIDEWIIDIDYWMSATCKET